MIEKRLLGACVAIGLAVWAPQVRAARLDASRWTVTDLGSGKSVGRVVADNDLATGTGAGGPGLLVDLGQEAVLQRVCLTPGNGITNGYAPLTIGFMTKPDGDPAAITRRYTTPTCDWWLVRDQRRKLQATGTNDFLPLNKAEADVRFNPTRARYLRIESATPVAELEVYGSFDKAAAEKRDAVVLGTNATDLLRVAAEDLRYYLGELTGRPLPIIRPEQEGDYPGTLYRLVDLRPLARTYPDMLANMKNGTLPGGGPVLESVISLYTMQLPDGVNVEKNGRAVEFRAWPTPSVAYSVWEFLRRQGVVWSAPADHADYVPEGKGVDLSILPLRYRPSAEWRHANFEVVPKEKQTGTFYQDDFLFFARNGYNKSWNTLEDFLNPMDGVPSLPQRATRSKKDVKPEHLEGFDGYPHNFAAVIPNRLLEQHPDWCGMRADGQRLAPSKGGPGTFCMTSTGAIDFVAEKMLDWIGDNRESRALFNLLPMDGTLYCQCDRCVAMLKPFASMEIPWVPLSSFMVSDTYYYFIAEVAKRVGAKAPNARIGALAYADVYAPPRKLDRLPDNVWIQVVQYGSRNLPMSSPPNAAVRQVQETWAKTCGHLSNYDYTLIHNEWMEMPMPTPMISAIVDRAKFLKKLNALNGGTQCTRSSLTHSPWDHYAYPRAQWDASLTADQIATEFFGAYYQEAKVPMLAYYKAMEEHMIRNNVDLQDVAYNMGPNPDAFPPALVEILRGHLAAAEKAAVSWYVKKRVKTAREDLEWGAVQTLRRSQDLATAVANGTKSYACRRKQGEIAVDGALDDAGWKNAPLATDFVTPGTFERVADREQVEFRMTWDDTTLYLAIRCNNTNTAALKAAEAVWGTDNVEWFVVPDQAYSGAALYQMALSAFNRSFGPERRVHDQWHKDLAWKGKGLETAVVRGDGFWTAELALPFKALKEGAPKAGEHWRFNICRNSGHGVSRQGTWSPLLYGMWHQYRDYNFVVFEGEIGK